ncbi:hypothetical protein BLA24064_04633 [Burkholderia latens]|uniref:Uncharacterized protein n=1 Tax=Burkholderia latens TaxID=488446 RepID=A0A6P2NRY9_9BURK|nr:hypothetical protein BLA24064_04633 [Burkholderia latens]
MVVVPAISTSATTDMAKVNFTVLASKTVNAAPGGCQAADSYG